MNIKGLQNMVRTEVKALKRNFKKEINYLTSLSFREYIRKLFLPTGKNIFVIILRILLFFPVFKFFYDSIFFIIKIIFNFYYIFFERVFEIFRKANNIIFLEGIIFRFNLKIINFFKYIVLFSYFINLNNHLKKKRISLKIYVLERIADIFIRILRRRFKIRYIFYPIIKIIEILVIFFDMIASTFAYFFDLLIIPLINILYHLVYLRIRMWWRYFKFMFIFNSRGPYYLNNVALFQISTMLKKNGFVAPVCKDKVIWYKAKLAARGYRRKYLRSELTPDVIDDKSLNIYIFLNDLLKDTRYQRKYFGFFDFIKAMFPHVIMVDIFFFLRYFLVGFAFFIYIILAPFFFLYFCYVMWMTAYGLLYYYYVLLFKDIDDVLIDMKRREIKNEKRKKKLKSIYKFFYDEFSFLYSSIKKFIIKVFSFLKKMYEKIFR